jgi:hypothetical protein
MSSPEDVAEALFRIDRLTKLMALDDAVAVGPTGGEAVPEKPVGAGRVSDSTEDTLTQVSSSEAVEYGCMKYGWKNGRFCFFREQLATDGAKADLDKMMCERGGVIYESFERAYDEPELWCEDVSIVDEALIRAAVKYFSGDGFSHIESNPFETVGNSQYCVRIATTGGSRPLLTFVTEDFGRHKNLYFHAQFDLTESEWRHLVTVFNDKRHSALTPDEFSRQLTAYAMTYIDGEHFSSLRYGRKNHEFKFYNEKMPRSDLASLSFLMSAHGGTIYEDYDRNPGDSRLLCEDIPPFTANFTPEKLMVAAIKHFRVEWTDIAVAFEEFENSRHCFRAKDGVGYTWLIMFEIEDFARGMKNLMLIGMYQLGSDRFAENKGLNFLKGKLNGVFNIRAHTENEFAHLAAEFARDLVNEWPEVVHTLVVSHRRKPEGGYTVFEETDAPWRYTELTRVILETGGVVFNYKSNTNGVLIYCQYRYQKPYKLNMPKLMPAAIRTLFPNWTDVRPACGVEDSMAQYCWSAKSRDGRNLLIVFGSTACHSSRFPVYDFWMTHLDIGDMPLELVRKRVDPMSWKSNHPESFASTLYNEAVKEISSRRRAAAKK